MMDDNDADELGPVDYVVVEFPADQANFSVSAIATRGMHPAGQSKRNPPSMGQCYGKQ